jgi:protein subunit release factor A
MYDHRMTYRLEFHAGDGGQDAALFASELAEAVARHADAHVTTVGRVLTVDCL